jgi:hypothetical protein
MAIQIQTTRRAALQTLVATPLLGTLAAPPKAWAAALSEYRAARSAFEHVARPLATIAWEDLTPAAQAANRTAGARLDAAYDAIIACPAPDVRALQEKADILLAENGDTDAASGFAVLQTDIARLAGR